MEPLRRPAWRVLRSRRRKLSREPWAAESHGEYPKADFGWGLREIDHAPHGLHPDSVCADRIREVEQVRAGLRAGSSTGPGPGYGRDVEQVRARATGGTFNATGPGL